MSDDPTRRRSRNPLLPIGHHFPDCEARVMPDGRLYLYGSLDTTRGSYCSDRYRVVSTADFAEWTVHDVSFRADQVPWAGPPDPGSAYALPDGRGGSTTVTVDRAMLYAPDALERDGRTYLYFCLSDGSEGVAVGDRPEGPFGDAVQLPATGIDPAVLVDDDGRTYYYWGQMSANGALLTDDLRGIDPTTVTGALLTNAEHHFHEGMSMRKRGALYYAVFADESRGRPTALGYATSTSPLGPFVYRGVIVDNHDCDPESWNNHGSIQEFDGRWYVFYHRSSRGDRAMRRVCAEPIAFTEDGLIPEVPMTSQGAGAPFSAGEYVPAFTACALSGTARLDAWGDTEALSGVGDGDSATFRYIRTDTPESALALHVEGTARIEAWVDGAIVGTAEPGADVVPLRVAPGTHELRLVFREPSRFVLVGCSVDRTGAERPSGSDLAVSA